MVLCNTQDTACFHKYVLLFLSMLYELNFIWLQKLNNVILMVWIELNTTYSSTNIGREH